MIPIPSNASDLEDLNPFALLRQKAACAKPSLSFRATGDARTDEPVAPDAANGRGLKILS
ncbi:hypothetical protein AA0472_1045 [Acetobacter estunensis NRIC 0472]|nr:hypothetical protein AA0472_1045 [Acetobacter estunensis NRIC 0472]